jgi:broad specificity phosphatase PhoE
MRRAQWLVRHGEARTGSDADGPVETDRAAEADRPDDPPLTETGRWQAERVGDRLRGRDIGAIYASPFRRATETAHLIAERLDRPVFVDHGLSAHLDASRFDVAPSVLRPRTLAERFGTVDPSYVSTLRPNYPESATEATDRTVRAVRRLLGDAPESTLLVGHRLTVGSVLAAFTGRTGGDTPPCGITRLTAYPWGWDVDLLADTSHLSADAVE